MEDRIEITRTMLVNVCRIWRQAELDGKTAEKSPDDIEQCASENADYLIAGLKAQIDGTAN